MPKALKDLFLDKDYQVPFVEKPAKPENIVNSELNKNRPLLQFGRNLPRVYGTDLIRIESRGSIDPARTLAVNSARAVDTKGGGFGRFISNLLGGGSANRPSDTIFPESGGAPVSKNGQPINGNWGGLKNAVEEDAEYKDIALQAINYKGPSGFNKLLNGLAKGNNPQEMAQEAIGRAAGAAQNLVTKGLTSVLTLKRKNAAKALAEKAKAKTLQEETKNGNFFDYKHKSSEYIKFYDSTKPDAAPEKKLRTEAGMYSFNDHIGDLLDNDVKTDEQLKAWIDKYSKSQLTYINFRRRNLDNTVENITLPAAIDGEITENINSEWNDYKYVGSPFKNYRYNGVERNLKLSFKVYWLEFQQRSLMESKLNKLRALCFPDTKVANVLLGQNTYKPYIFTPTLVKFSIPNYYENLNVIIKGMSISVPQNISWASDNPDLMKQDGKTIIYPTFVNVSMDMTIIETHTLANSTEGMTYQFDKMKRAWSYEISRYDEGAQELKTYDGKGTVE